MKRALTILACLAFATPAFAVDFTQPILDFNGAPMHETSDPASPIVTLGLAASAALLRQQTTPDGRPQPIDPIKSAKRALLAQRIARASDATLTAEETAEIKTLISVFPPIYVLRVIEAIDPVSLK